MLLAREEYPAELSIATVVGILSECPLTPKAGRGAAHRRHPELHERRNGKIMHALAGVAYIISPQSAYLPSRCGEQNATQFSKSRQRGTSSHLGFDRAISSVTLSRLPSGSSASVRLRGVAAGPNHPVGLISGVVLDAPIHYVIGISGDQC